MTIVNIIYDINVFIRGSILHFSECLIENTVKEQQKAELWHYWQNYGRNRSTILPWGYLHT